MIILALNTEDEHISNLPIEKIFEIPNKDDVILFEKKEYKVLYRYFQYSKAELDIVNIVVEPIVF